MTTRTFKQKGQAYGGTTGSIVVTIDGNVVYSGTVDTVDSPMPTFPNAELRPNVDIYTWQNDVGFSGTQTLEIQVSGATLLLAESIANYGQSGLPTDPGVADEYIGFYTYESGSDTIGDPFTNVEIDGIPMERDNSLTGQWYWTIPAGSTFSATINVQAGKEPAV